MLRQHSVIYNIILTDICECVAATEHMTDSYVIPNVANIVRLPRQPHSGSAHHMHQAGMPVDGICGLKRSISMAGVCAQQKWNEMWTSTCNNSTDHYTKIKCSHVQNTRVVGLVCRKLYYFDTYNFPNQIISNIILCTFYVFTVQRIEQHSVLEMRF